MEALLPLTAAWGPRLLPTSPCQSPPPGLIDEPVEMYQQGLSAARTQAPRHALSHLPFHTALRRALGSVCRRASQEIFPYSCFQVPGTRSVLWSLACLLCLKGDPSDGPENVHLTPSPVGNFRSSLKRKPTKQQLQKNPNPTTKCTHCENCSKVLSLSFGSVSQPFDVGIQ